MEDIFNMWCLEYSFSQNSFYSAPLIEILRQNQEAIEKGEQHDFIIVAMYFNKEYLEGKADEWARKVNAKILYRDIYGNLIVKPNESED